MIPCAIIEEVATDEVTGSATSASNLLVFTPSALIAPAYGWLLNDRAGDGGKPILGVFQGALSVGVAGIIPAIVLSCFLREAGSASRPLVRTLAMKAPS